MFAGCLQETHQGAEAEHAGEDEVDSEVETAADAVADEVSGSVRVAGLAAARGGRAHARSGPSDATIQLTRFSLSLLLPSPVGAT